MNKSLFDGLELDDLDPEQRELADCIGLEAYKKLTAAYAGSTITVRMPDKLTLVKRNRQICSEFNGYNFYELARKYSLTERHIRNIVADRLRERKNEQPPEQITFFDNK